MATVSPAALVLALAAILPGKVLLPASAVVPADARLRVSLHDLSRGVPEDAAVAADSFPTTGKKPLRFELEYNTQLIEPNRLYGVAAVITDALGKKLWETRIPIRVLTMGNQKSVELTLQPSKTAKPAAEATAFGIECGQLHLHVSVHGQEATLVGLDTPIVLPRIQTPTGMKFSDGATTLSILGDAVYFQRTQRAYRDCRLTDPAPR